MTLITALLIIGFLTWLLFKVVKAAIEDADMEHKLNQRKKQDTNERID